MKRNTLCGKKKKLGQLVQLVGRFKFPWKNQISFNKGELFQLGAKTVLVPVIIPLVVLPTISQCSMMEKVKIIMKRLVAWSGWMCSQSSMKTCWKKSWFKLQQQYPETTIIHASYNGALIDIFQSAEHNQQFQTHQSNN